MSLMDDKKFLYLQLKRKAICAGYDNVLNAHKHLAIDGKRWDAYLCTAVDADINCPVTFVLANGNDIRIADEDETFHILCTPKSDAEINAYDVSKMAESLKYDSYDDLGMSIESNGKTWKIYLIYNRDEINACVGYWPIYVLTCEDEIRLADEQETKFIIIGNDKNEKICWYTVTQEDINKKAKSMGFDSAENCNSQFISDKIIYDVYECVTNVDIKGIVGAGDFPPPTFLLVSENKIKLATYAETIKIMCGSGE